MTRMGKDHVDMMADMIRRCNELGLNPFGCMEYFRGVIPSDIHRYAVAIYFADLGLLRDGLTVTADHMRRYYGQ